METDTVEFDDKKWYAISLISVLIFSILGYNIVHSEVIKPQLNDGSVIELGRYTFTYDAYDFISERENHSIIALGSSKMREAFNGIDLEEKSQHSNVEFFNLAFAAERPYYRMLEIEKIIETKPELVVMEVGPTTYSRLNTPLDESSLSRMNAIIKQQGWSDQNSWIDILEPEDRELLAVDFLERVELESYYSFSAIETSLADNFYDEETGYSCDETLSNVRCVPSQESELYLDYLKYPVQFGDHLASLKSQGPEALEEFYGERLDKYINSSLHNPEGVYNKNHRAFDFMVEELTSHNIEVLLVALPYNPVFIDRLEPGQWDYYNNSISEYASNSSVNFLDLVWSSPFKYDTYFNDFAHMSKSGEDLFTDLLIPEVDSILSSLIDDFVFDKEHNYSIREIIEEEEDVCGTNELIHINQSYLIPSTQYYSCEIGSNGHIWTNVTEDGNTFLKALPDDNITLGDPGFVTYQIDLESSDNYSFWFNLRGPYGRSDSLHIEIDGIGYTYEGRGLGAGTNWTWKNSGTDIPPIDIYLEQGTHEIKVIMREDGVEFSQIFIGMNGETPPETMEGS